MLLYFGWPVMCDCGNSFHTPGRIAQSIACLTSDAGVPSKILAWTHTFVEIDNEIISMAILLRFADSSMCTKNWLTARSIWPRKKCV